MSLVWLLEGQSGRAPTQKSSSRSNSAPHEHSARGSVVNMHRLHCISNICELAIGQRLSYSTHHAHGRNFGSSQAHTETCRCTQKRLKKPTPDKPQPTAPACIMGRATCSQQFALLLLLKCASAHQSRGSSQQQTAKCVHKYHMCSSQGHGPVFDHTLYTQTETHTSHP